MAETVAVMVTKGSKLKHGDIDPVCKQCTQDCKQVFPTKLLSCKLFEAKAK